MLLVDFGSANHREKSATPATYNHKYALFMPHSCHDIDSISLKIVAILPHFISTKPKFLKI